MPFDSFTYVSQSPSCGTSWIDHILVSSPSLIDNCSILYGTTFDDHIPLFFNLNVPCDVTASRATPCDSISQSDFFVLWDKVTREQIHEYASALEYFCTDFLNEAILCNTENCSDQNHKQLLNRTLYDFLKDSIFSSSVVFPSSGNCPRIRKQPGWNIVETYI